MPPKGEKRPAQADWALFLKAITVALTTFEEQGLAQTGRAVWRRLNRTEYENTLRDLLQVPLLRVQSQLPEDGEAFRFNKVSNALDVSYVHMARYMSAAEYAMCQAWVGWAGE